MDGEVLEIRPAVCSDSAAQLMLTSSEGDAAASAGHCRDAAAAAEPTVSFSAADPFSQSETRTSMSPS